MSGSSYIREKVVHMVVITVIGLKTHLKKKKRADGIRCGVRVIFLIYFYSKYAF